VIVDLLALLMIFVACATAGIMFTSRRRLHERAERQAAAERLADATGMYAGREPAGVDPRDRLLI
jgi:hypothetical protein